MRPIHECVVVITGASSGIGRATALAFARRGASVVVAARREQALRDLAKECQQLGGRSLAVPTDVTDESAVTRLAQRTMDVFGRLDVWVNNAAVTMFGRTEEVPSEGIRQVIDTNLLGYFHGARAAIRQFREQGAGVLINVSSVVGKVGQPHTSAYVASKFGIIGLSSCLRQELQDVPEIHVCTVLPASTDTPLFQQAANYSGRAVKPMSPIYDPDQVAETIVGCVERPQREVAVGNHTSQALLINALMPGWTERQLASKVERDHFEDRPAQSTSGNLFEPRPEYAVVRGGWSEPKQRNRIKVLAATCVAIGLGLVAWWIVPAGSMRRLQPRRLRWIATRPLELVS